MELSRHNIISKIHQSDEYFIVNLLSGNADILTTEEVQRVYDNKVSSDQALISKGYVVDPAAENKLFRSRYLDFIDSRDTDEMQLFYVPTYSCNFGCSYCYQNGYDTISGFGGNVATADAFFQYITSAFKGRRKYVTLFGGEPLLPDKNSKEFLKYFLSRCQALNLDVAIVTNGYHLNEYLSILSLFNIREIQVTLDGPREVHNARRPLKSGEGTFDRIAEGIDSALTAGIPVNLRVVLDRENINSLNKMAQFAIDKRWTDSQVFKTQLGRNYELHYCQTHQSRLYSRIELYRDLYDLIKKHPELLQFHKPAYSVSKFLFENGELPDPLFDSCPGCKTEWAFDYTGKIYSCTATVGKSGEELGTFYPEVKLNHEKVGQWNMRDIFSIHECTSCNLRLACGGGCASVAFNTCNKLDAPDCRPVKELLELGIALYRDIV
ncbi:MAG TPA: radical SAM protein [Bacteroidales bacterium]|jgi:uncharacterized protein|nr:radical SAM protein [Bacteroidales bacterium]